MIKGDNGFVPSVPLRIAVRGGLDAMALLVTERGTVRGDGDVVFHGSPVHPSGAVRLTEAGDGTAWLEIGLASVEERIARVLLVGSTERGTMRDVAGLVVEAYAPDGTSVARYEVTDGAGETAMVLAELYRRAGGWKFRAVGQGYANGLAGLATDHGVDVAEQGADGAAPVPPVAPPMIPLPPQAPNVAVPPHPAPAFASPPPPAPAFASPPPPAPAFASPPPPAPAFASRHPAPAFAPPPPPPPGFAAPAPPPAFASPAPPLQPAPPSPYPSPPPPPAPSPPPYVPAPAGWWSYGPVFTPYTQTGRDNDVITVSGLPPGPVVVQLDVQGDGYTGLTVLNRRNKEQDLLVNSTEEDFRGRLLATVPGNGTLRMRLEADGPWRVEVSPLAAARRLTEEEAEFRGPDVLLHMGGVADLAIHYRGDDNLIVNIYELAGHDDHTALPEDENVVNEIGRRHETVPLPEGPLVVQVEAADSSWTARLRRL
ncbi:TerD family protein [Streptomyces sp. NBC_00094]|uniref:TerD family protein n=1 Tax=Streptomyces sp. NBC_00094 TaxID=2903620 RepID=UPI0022586095|nr:TerD family protein [Streptomyces sp. NBC_00094]MCX5394872.1 TerD family protein [Streptomyces sp. NBC_00094]